MKTAKRRRQSQWSRRGVLNLGQTPLSDKAKDSRHLSNESLENDDSAESRIDMDGSGKRRVDLVVRFTEDEMDDLRKICRIRDCAPEGLLRELALCELAQYRSIKYFSKPCS